jgi:hypothetical protein
VPVNVITRTLSTIDPIRVLPGKAIPTPKGGDIYEIDWRRGRLALTTTKICNKEVVADAGCLEEGGCNWCDGNVVLVTRGRAEEWRT